MERKIEKKKAEALVIKIENEKHKIENLSDDDLQKMHADYHNGIACDNLFGSKPSKLVEAIDEIIEHELEKRGMKTLSDLEGDIWFSQHRKI